VILHVRYSLLSRQWQRFEAGYQYIVERKDNIKLYEYIREVDCEDLD
jgi:hypothetical protein